jgi:intervening sequence
MALNSRRDAETHPKYTEYLASVFIRADAFNIITEDTEKMKQYT